MSELSPKGNRALLTLLPLLLLANVFIYRSVISPEPFTAAVLPVENGQAFLVRARSSTLLIDAGADASILRALGTSLPEWRRDINVLVLTSPVASVAGGAPEVLTRYRVAELVRPEARGSRTLEAALAEASAGTHTAFARAGERFTLTQDVYLDVLWPPETPSVMAPDTGALALQLTCGRRTFFIETGLDPRTAKTAAALASKDAIRLSSSTPAQTFSCG